MYRAHVLPRPYLEEGRFLAGLLAVTSAIDVSDGLSSDLGHIAARSGVGARIYEERIPVSPELGIFCSRFGFNPVEFALSGGEDYTLLFTVQLNAPLNWREVIRRSSVRESGHLVKLLIPE